MLKSKNSRQIQDIIFINHLKVRMTSCEPKSISSNQLRSKVHTIALCGIYRHIASHTSPRISCNSFHYLLKEQCRLHGAGSNNSIIFLTPLPHSLICKAISVMKLLNSNGDKLQPCFSPIVTLNNTVKNPLICTQIETTAYNDLMAFYLVPPIPRCSSLYHNSSLLTEL